MNKLIKCLILALITSMFFVGCKADVVKDDINKNETLEEKNEEKEDDSINENNEVKEEVEKIDEIQGKIDNMSLDEKIGQLFIVGFDGQYADENITSLIKNNYVGGVIFFSPNVESLQGVINLTNEFKEINSSNKNPLFISVDEEGGNVSRTPNEFLPVPTAGYIGSFNNEDINYEVGQILADELKVLGYNMDFAPSLDILSNPYNTVIGDRAYGTDADTVSRLGIKTMEGIRDGGIIPVIKHFPGHGDTSVDSHYGLPLVEKTLEELKKLELITFQNAINDGADVVMVSHILLSNVDSENPASMSKEVITNILREDMGFNGVVITDDMTMGAIMDGYDLGQSAVKSINAGTDIILVCHGYDNELYAINSVKEAVESGVITEERINESVYRILSLKEKYKVSDTKIENTNDVSDINNRIQNLTN